VKSVEALAVTDYRHAMQHAAVMEIGPFYSTS